MKLLLLSIYIFTQVIWVEGAATSAAGCQCDQIKIINNGGDGNLVVGVWDTTPGAALINDRPVYKKQSILDELYLKFDAGQVKWHVTASPTDAENDTTNPTAGSSEGTAFCAEELVSGWKLVPSQQLGYIADLVDANLMARCVNCTGSPEDCGTCDCPKIKVVNVTSEADGYYLPLIGMRNDDRTVYKRVGSGSDQEVYLISVMFNWELTKNITEGLKVALRTWSIASSVPINATHCVENTPGPWSSSTDAAVRCSDCSSNLAPEYEECAASCPPCKDVLEGTMMGLYTLEVDKDVRCTNGCVYKKEDKLYCFKEGGPSVKLSCGTP